MTLEFIYWLALGAGVGFLALSLLLGDLFDFLDFDFIGADFSVAPVFFAGIAAFGAGGLIALEMGGSTGASIAAGLGTGAVAAILAALLFAVLHRQQAQGGFELSQLVGERGRLTMTVGPGRVGKISISYGGITRALAATSDDEIGAGEEVLVTDVVGSTVTVSRRAPGEGG